MQGVYMILAKILFLKYVPCYTIIQIIALPIALAYIVALVCFDNDYLVCLIPARSEIMLVCYTP